MLDLVLAMLLRDHTATHTDHKGWLFCLEVLILPHNGECLLLGMLANGAGVDHDQVGILGGFRNRISHCLAQPRDLFAVGFVLLTAKGELNSVDEDSTRRICYLPG